MHRIRDLLIAIVTAALPGGWLAPCTSAAADSPWHNQAYALDVDDNQLVQPRDVLLIINQLQQPPNVTPLTVPPPVDLNDVFYWDTSNDGRVAPLDALLVINHLIAVPAPEPSTLVLAGMAGAALAGRAWRRRR